MIDFLDILVKSTPEQVELFVYGTLRLPKIVKQVLGHYDPEKATTIKNYKIIEHLDDYKELVPSEGSSIKGDILMIHTEDLTKLRNWEHERYTIDKLPGGVYYFKYKEKMGKSMTFLEELINVGFSEMGFPKEEELDLSDSDTYSRLVEIKKAYDLKNRPSFLSLLKGGLGSGQRGHTTARLNYPNPGEALPLVPEKKEELEEIDPKQTYIPPEGTTPHYSDSNEMRIYKRLLTTFKQKGIVPHGHITINPQTNEILPLSSTGRRIIDELVAIGKKMQAKESEKTPLKKL